MHMQNSSLMLTFSKIQDAELKYDMQVLYADYGIAIVDDLDNDAPIGTSISFSNNACG